MDTGACGPRVAKRRNTAYGHDLACRSCRKAPQQLGLMPAESRAQLLCETPPHYQRSSVHQKKVVHHRPDRDNQIPSVTSLFIGEFAHKYHHNNHRGISVDPAQVGQENPSVVGCKRTTVSAWCASGKDFRLRPCCCPRNSIPPNMLRVPKMRSHGELGPSYAKTSMSQDV